MSYVHGPDRSTHMIGTSFFEDLVRPMGSQEEWFAKLRDKLPILGDSVLQFTPTYNPVITYARGGEIKPAYGHNPALAKAIDSKQLLRVLLASETINQVMANSNIPDVPITSLRLADAPRPAESTKRYLLIAALGDRRVPFYPSGAAIRGERRALRAEIGIREPEKSLKDDHVAMHLGMLACAETARPISQATLDQFIAEVGPEVDLGPLGSVL